MSVQINWPEGKQSVCGGAGIAQESKQQIRLAGVRTLPLKLGMLFACLCVLAISVALLLSVCVRRVFSFYHASLGANGCYWQGDMGNGEYGQGTLFAAKFPSVPGITCASRINDCGLDDAVRDYTLVKRKALLLISEWSIRAL